MAYDRHPHRGYRTAFGLLILTSVVLLPLVLLNCSSSSVPSFTTPYQAVLLDNGAAYFGKVVRVEAGFLVLTDVFYIQSQQSPDGKQVANILVKRGGEWHGPDRMYIASPHVVMIEPVSPDSKVAQLIKEEKARGENVSK